MEEKKVNYTRDVDMWNIMAYYGRTEFHIRFRCKNLMMSRSNSTQMRTGRECSLFVGYHLVFLKVLYQVLEVHHIYTEFRCLKVSWPYLMANDPGKWSRTLILKKKIGEHIVLSKSF